MTRFHKSALWPDHGRDPVRPVSGSRLTARRGLIRCGLLLAALAIGACQATPPRKPTPAPARPAATTDKQAPNSNTDPCAMRLHDVCGPLLLYYATHHRLPERIEELGEVPGFEEVRDFSCPACGRPYVYNPIGIVNANTSSQLILYDPAPVHSGMRWAISIIEPKDENAPLISKVVALPESHFSLSAPTAKPDAKPDAKPK